LQGKSKSGKGVIKLKIKCLLFRHLNLPREYILIKQKNEEIKMGLNYIMLDTEKTGFDELGFKIDRAPVVTCDVCQELIAQDSGNVIFEVSEEIPPNYSYSKLIFVHKGNCDKTARKKYNCTFWIPLDKFLESVLKNMKHTKLIDSIRIK
jgi:hypothetical protein